MIAVINAGGSGSRLWPLSTPDYPKHLLSIGNGNSKSLIQNTYERVSDIADTIYVITEKSHAQHVIDQLPDIDADKVIIEPARRGTASCLLLALDKISESHMDNEPILFMHADHVIHDVNSFADTVKHATKTSIDRGSIVLMGVEPFRPSTGFGYIKKGDKASQEEERSIYNVAEFKEKPNRETAEKYVRAGEYLWNMGYFAAPLGVFVKTMKRDAPKLHKGYEKLQNAADKEEEYLILDDDAIDYALIEKATSLLVVPGDFDWIDVGNFEDLHTVAPHDDNANAVIGYNLELEDVYNAYLRNDTDTKIAVIGLDNIAVVMTDHGLVVANRAHAHKVGDVAKRFRKK